MKLYSGFYQHTVRSQLYGTEAVFYQLGYQLQEEGELFLDGPVDPDRVARVALDCLTACVECQVMLQICEKVKSFKCSWPEILRVREEYVCGIEEAVRILQLLKRTALDQEKQSRAFKVRENQSLKDKQDPGYAQSHQKTGILVDVSNTWPSSVSSHPGYTEGTLLPHSSPHAVPCPPKSGKGVLVSHSKSPSWSEGVTSHGDGYHQSRSTSKLDHDHVTGLLDDHVKGGHTVMDSSHINSPRYSINSDSLPDNREESWDLLHSPVHKLQYQSNYPFGGFEHDAHQMGYNPVPNVKMNYGPQYAHSFPTHMMPLGVPGYPYPIPHNLIFNSRQCQCRMCIEQQQHLIVANRMNSKDLPQTFCSPENSVYNRSDRHPAEEPFDINSALINLTLEGHSPGPKLGQFPLDNSSYMIHKTPSNPTRDAVTLRPNNTTKSQTCGKRGSYYDNVPSTAEAEVVSHTSGMNMVSKNEQSANGPVTLSTSSNKPRSQKGITSTDSAGNSTMSRSFQQELLSTEPANCMVVQVHKYPNPSLSSDPPKNTKSSSSVQRNPKESKRWSCQSCTFYNLADKRICDMCGRSRFPGPESMPLVSGGRECPQCTLVNKKDCEDCTACGASLKDSPTYI